MVEMLMYGLVEEALKRWDAAQVLGFITITLTLVMLADRLVPYLRVWRHAHVVRRPYRPALRREEALHPVTPDESIALPDVERDDLPTDTDEWRSYVDASGVEVVELGTPSPRRTDDETRDLIVRLRLELAEAQGVADDLQGDAVARVRGRLHSWRGQQVAVLAVLDGDGHQRIMVSVPDVDERQALAVGTRVEVVARYVGGRLVAERFIEAEADPSPLPDLPEPIAKNSGVPDWFDSMAKNEKRPLLKASDGSSSVSDLKVHLVFAVKRRGAVLTAPMVERFKQLAAQAVEEKGLGKLLGANCESDHAHLALWLPVNVAPSDAMGQIKSFTSRHLRKEFPVLVEHHAGALWQRGGFVGSIGNGGDLSVVLNYIANQDAPEAAQDDQEGFFDDDEGDSPLGV